MTLEGTLSKWTNVMKGWQYRFFVLDENAGLLSYYTSKEKMMKGVRRGCVRLKDAVIGIDDQEDNTFTITVDHKTFHFQAQHSEEREKWVRRLEDTIRRHANRSRLWDGQSTFYLGGYQKELGSQRANHLELLGRRVFEADAYLQLMIEQTNKIEKRIAEISDPDEQAKCKALQDNASAMLDHIKHSIVSLQIAKNMAHPINGIYNGPTTVSVASTPVAGSGDAGSAHHSSGSIPAAESNGEDEEDSATENGSRRSLPLQGPDFAVGRKVSCGPYSDGMAYEYGLRESPSSSTASQYLQTSLTDYVEPIADGIELATDCDLALIAASPRAPPDNCTCDRTVTTAPLTLAVPATSYSSSEGEEDFYDAYDDPFSSISNSPIGCATRGFSVETSPTHEHPPDGLGRLDNALKTMPTVPTVKGMPTPSAVGLNELDEYQVACSGGELKGSSAAVVALPMQLQHTPGLKIPTAPQQQYAASSEKKSFYNNDGSIDYDALYEEEEDTTISMEAHGSMISHLLSQVKIGMDLTKVVLPTFILERRSLLEMYADYFAHPDLFLKIADLDSPRDRIVQVCRWYLSAYHAGRKSTVAKKPYNPILGEIFQCYWDIPGEEKDSSEVKDGPVPWCHRNQLTFLAEQVSHHPPISAFYAEHYNRKISFTAHVWTKSKFLGLSIGVHNIGEGIVTLVDRKEEYIVTFPNGYGRSILTVPWIELGGSVEIRCPQTGYYANTEFLTKPFYGGKRNKVTAEIYAPNEKKPFVSIAGEWTGLMEAKWHDKNKTEVFVDVNRIPIFKKQVRPIVEQEEYESRRVWKEVTAGLKFNDIEKATNAKCAVEQRQRDTAKARKDNEQAWEHKYFKPLGENWIYTNPLSQRCYLQEKEGKS